MQLLLTSSKADYYATVIDQNRGNQKELFRIMDHSLCRKTDSKLPDLPPDELPDKFAGFFIKKISAIHSNLSGNADPPSSMVSSVFPSRNLIC